MNNKTDIDIKIEAVLNSLEGMQTASPGPYFFTRVQARLNVAEKTVWEKVSSYMARPAVAIAIVLSVILMNAVAVIHEKSDPSSLVDQSEQSVYEDFNVAANTFYDYEISEP
jgi:hypothetical protein